MKLKIVAASMLVALGGWIIPFKTAHAAVPEPNVSSTININVPIQPPTKVDDTPKPIAKAKVGVSSGRHNTRSDIKISVEALTTYLESKGSPLAAHSGQILESPYWSTIIGICTIEQYSCSKAPYNNYWGLMKRGGGLQHFATLPDGIEAINAFLTKGEASHPTIESMKGWYCASACTNWQPTVLRVKAELESLN